MTGVGIRRTSARRGPERDPGYLRWLRENGKCGICERTGCDPCHTVNNGMSSKGPDRGCAPLCREHHREYDAGRKTFENRHEIDMAQLAAAWHRIYLIVEKGK